MQTKKWKIVFVIPVLWWAISAGGAEVFQVRQLSLGVQQHLDFPEGVKKIALADPEVVHVVMDRVPGQGNTAKLLVTPLKVGTTSLKVWGEKSAQPSALLLEVRPSFHVREGQYQHLADMVRKESAIKEAKGREIAALNASQLQHKSNVVQVDVKIVEVNKTKLKQAGLNILSTGPNSHGFSFGAPFTGGGGTGDVSSPFGQAFGLLLGFGKANLQLNFGLLEGSGMARVLAQPSLLAISGQSANFLSGGEVPVPVAQGDGAVSVEYKPYGIGLTVSPTILDNQRIVLKVSPESSELDYVNSVDMGSGPMPALTVRRADTTIELGDGESFVIGGLVSQNTRSNVNRIPVLSEIPILGMLFKRQEFARSELELVIVVTPRLVKPIANHTLLAAQLPGAEQEQRKPAGFWSSYIGPSGGSDRLPGFSQ